ncbi:helix-turn-helix domain-containing protein [Salmonella enterica]|nr:helix-turn-helix domain-containing protein [Salmonella enterica]ECV6735402.1 helix-turn-helix domain-containing protein [Salmonella enterica]
MKLGEYLRNSGLSQRDFGKKVGASQGMVSHVLNGRARLTGRNSLLWSECTGWRVTPHDLRPDIYPNPTDGLPLTHKHIISSVKTQGVNNHDHP